MLIDQIRNEVSENLCYHQDEEKYINSLSNLWVINRENEIVKEQTLHDVKLLIEKLPSTQREVVFMRYYQELSFKEIAEAKGISINTALGRMHYALQNMKAMAKKMHMQTY